MKDLFWLTQTQLDRMAPHFPLSHGIPRVDDLRVISGIIHVIKRGFTRSTPSVRCMASRVGLRHRPTPSLIQAIGSTLHVVGVCVNRIGKRWRLIEMNLLMIRYSKASNILFRIGMN